MSITFGNCTCEETQGDDWLPERPERTEEVGKDGMRNEPDAVPFERGLPFSQVGVVVACVVVVTLLVDLAWRG